MPKNAYKKHESVSFRKESDNEFETLDETEDTDDNMSKDDNACEHGLRDVNEISFAHAKKMK